MSGNDPKRTRPARAESNTQKSDAEAIATLLRMDIVVVTKDRQLRENLRASPFRLGRELPYRLTRLQPGDNKLMANSTLAQSETTSNRLAEPQLPDGNADILWQN